MEKPDTVVEDTSLHEVTESIVFDNKQLYKITPVSSFEISGDELQVFPHFNNEAYINVKRIVISGNKFWTSVCKDAKKSNNYFKDKEKGYTVISRDGKSYGYIEINEEEAYLATTDSLPSSYVRLVLDQLCSTDT